MKFYRYSSSPVGLEKCGLAVKALAGNFLSAILILFFAVVGMVVGAITGCIKGQEYELGVLRGAAVGAIYGALISFEVFDSFLRLWRTGRNRIQCLLYLIHVTASVLRGKPIRVLVGTVMTNIAGGQPQVGDTEYISEMVLSFYKTVECKELPRSIVEKIPTMEITTKNHADPWGEIISCSVCLQDCQLGDRVRKLPCSRHMFHQRCIDQWLIDRGLCPLCRSHF